MMHVAFAVEIIITAVIININIAHTKNRPWLFISSD